MRFPHFHNSVPIDAVIAQVLLRQPCCLGIMSVASLSLSRDILSRRFLGPLALKIFLIPSVVSLRCRSSIVMYALVLGTLSSALAF